MTFTLFLTNRAKDDLKKLPEKIHRQIIADIQSLETRPFPDGKRVKKLRGFKEELYRLRAGDYRIIFTREQRSVVVVRIIAKKDFEKVYG